MGEQRMLPKFKLLKDESGQALVLVALLMVVLLGFAALVIDVGSLYITKANLQNAADAAALAGAKDLGTSNDATATAKNYAKMNGCENTAVNPTNTNPTKIEVICTKTVPRIFAVFLSNKDTDVSARAVAQKSGINIEAFNNTLFSGSEDVFITSNKTTKIKGDVYGYTGINAPGAEIDGDAVVNGSSNINITSANNKIQNRVETIPDLWPVVQTQKKHCKNMSDFLAQTHNGTKLDDYDIVYYEGSLDLSNKPISGKGIIFATGQITLDGGGQASKNDSIIFYSGASGFAIHFTGSGQFYIGFLYTPNGTCKFSGTSAVLNGRVISKTEIKFAGGDADIDGSISTDVFNMFKESVKLVE